MLAPIDGGESEESVTLSALPKEVLLHICEHLSSPASLGRLCLASVSANDALLSKEASCLWEAWCKRHGVVQPSSGKSAKIRFGEHFASLCVECNKPTRYIYALTGRRLCEACEATSPHVYGLATQQQLLHERSVVSMLSNEQRHRLFASVPSLEVAGARWYRRTEAVAAARAMLDDATRMTTAKSGSTRAANAVDVSVDDAGASADCHSKATAADGCPAGRRQGADGQGRRRGTAGEEGEEGQEGQEGQEGTNLDAGMRLRRNGTKPVPCIRRAGNREAARALERDARKAHKKKVKAEQARKREQATALLQASRRLETAKRAACRECTQASASMSGGGARGSRCGKWSSHDWRGSSGLTCAVCRGWSSRRDCSVPNTLGRNSDLRSP